MKKFAKYFNKKYIKIIALAIIFKLAGEKKLQNKIPLTQLNSSEPEISRVISNSSIKDTVISIRCGSDNITDDTVKDPETKTKIDSQKPTKVDKEALDELLNISEDFNKSEATVFESCIRNTKTTIKTKKAEVYQSVGTIQIGRKTETSEEITTVRTQIDNSNRMDVNNQIIEVADDLG